MADITVDRIRLIGVESGTGPGNAPCWIVKIGYFPRGADPMMVITWELPKNDFDEVNLVRIARHYFHKITGMFHESTQSWEVSDEDFALLKKDYSAASGEKTGVT